MLGVQVLPARRRGRPRPLLDVRAARLRGGGGLDAALPGPRLLRPRDRAHQLRRGAAAQRRAARGRPRPRSRRSRSSPTTSAGSASCTSRRRRSPSTRASTSTSGSRATRTSTARSRWPTCPARRRARVHDQALSRAATSRACWRTGTLSVGDELRSTAPTGCSRCGTSSPRRLRVHRRRRRHGADPGAAAPAGRVGHRAPGASTTTARAAEADLFHLEELERSARPAELPFVPALSEADGDVGRRAGLITDVVERMEERPGRGRRLPVRPAADGRRRDRDARAPAGARVAHLLRQVHDHRGLR